MSETSIDSIRARLVLHKGRWPAIAEFADIDYGWLQKFGNGERGKRPSYEQITKLVNALDKIDAGLGEGVTNVQ